MIRTLFKPDWRALWQQLELPDSASVYTRPDVVALILDLTGYQKGDPALLDRRVLEPSCGEGAFLREIVSRLLAAVEARREDLSWEDPRWDGAITAVDLSSRAVDISRAVVLEHLLRAGCPEARAAMLAGRWVFQTDFLLHDWSSRQFDVVVGNPPYLRIEDIPARVCAEYRALWGTATDRADLYVPFFECGLELLSTQGALGFICANRFAKNQYGAALRRLIADRYHVRHYINLEHTQPFLADVSAYPAIIVLDRMRGASTHAESVEDLAPATLDRIREGHGGCEAENCFDEWYPDGAPWISTSKTKRAGLLSLEKEYPTIEASAPGTRIGIGIATGADDVFVLPARRDDIEASRQVPLILSSDISNESADCSGSVLVNPFSDAGDGSLVRLEDFPGFRAYVEQHADRLKKRHCAKNRPQQWFRTIDRYWPALTTKPKLVIPDIQPGGIIGYESGRAYPHHNVYWISSDSWDLRELQAILQSDFVTDQVRAFSVAMRGGSLRYQVQTLRKIRVPRPVSATAARAASPLGL
jgi:methylase of polypeptide subunit release factors